MINQKDLYFKIITTKFNTIKMPCKCCCGCLCFKRRFRRKAKLYSPNKKVIRGEIGDQDASENPIIRSILNYKSDVF